MSLEKVHEEVAAERSPAAPKRSGVSAGFASGDCLHRELHQASAVHDDDFSLRNRNCYSDAGAAAVSTGQRTILCGSPANHLDGHTQRRTEFLRLHQFAVLVPGRAEREP